MTTCPACGAKGPHFCTGGQPQHPGWGTAAAVPPTPAPEQVRDAVRVAEVVAEMAKEPVGVDALDALRRMLGLETAGAAEAMADAALETAAEGAVETAHHTVFALGVAVGMAAR